MRRSVTLVRCYRSNGSQKSADMESDTRIAENMYLQRTLSRTIPRISDAFPVFLLTGPRQVGKTTLPEHCSDSSRRTCDT